MARLVIKYPLRRMLLTDVPRMLEIEQASFEYPWTARELSIPFKQVNAHGRIAEHGDTTVGYVLYESHSYTEKKPGRLNIYNIAVDPKVRRQGVGTQMMQQLMEAMCPRRLDCIELRVRERNLGAQQFFKHLGFRATGVDRDFWDKPGEDAYRFELRLRTTE